MVAGFVGSAIGLALSGTIASAATVGIGATADVTTGSGAGVNASAVVSGHPEFQGSKRMFSSSTSTRPRAGVYAGRTASSTAGMTGQINVADVEIRNRIDALQKLNTRINSMIKVSAGEKTSLQTEIQNEIAALTTLQNSFASATSTAEIRTERQSITGSYRIYALVVPQTSIIAAVDRVENLVTMMTTLGAKLQTRLASSTVSAANQSAMADFTAKVSDAQTQAVAAQAEVINLTPDQGNQTQLGTNTAALKDARAKLQTATQDLTAARANAAGILKSLGVSVSTAVTANSAVETSGQ